jgi:hypothetical protein
MSVAGIMAIIFVLVAALAPPQPPSVHDREIGNGLSRGGLPIFIGQEANATCPVCGEKFHLNYHHGNGMVFQEYPCPNCGIVQRELVYYNAHDHSRRQPVGHAEKRPRTIQEQLVDHVEKAKREHERKYGKGGWEGVPPGAERP